MPVWSEIRGRHREPGIPALLGLLIGDIEPDSVLIKYHVLPSESAELAHPAPAFIEGCDEGTIPISEARFQEG